MSKKFSKYEFVPSEEKCSQQFKGKNLKEVIEYLEDKEEIDESKSNGMKKKYNEYSNIECQSIFNGFLDLLREKGVKVSTPEWLQFLKVIADKTSAEDLKKMVSTDQLLNKIRLFAQTTLVKDKADEPAFHEAFDEYFELAAKVYRHKLKEENDSQDNHNNAEPKLKEELGIKEVDEKLDLQKYKQHYDEKKHGGKEDQHNDILKKEDLTKKGGGDKKEGSNGEGDKEEQSKEKERKGESKHNDYKKVKDKDNNDDIEKKDKKEHSNIGRGSKEGIRNQDITNPPTLSANAEQKQVSQKGFLVGGGKGKSIYAERVLSNQFGNEMVRMGY